MAIVYVLDRVKKISGRATVGLKCFFHDPLREVLRNPVLLLDGGSSSLIATAVFVILHDEVTSQHIWSQK